MRTRAFLYLLGLIVISGGTVAASDSAWAQNSSPAASGALEAPIGKVVTAKGESSIEHTAAVVVQANIAGIGRAKVGDLVYRGDIVQTGSDGAIGLSLADGTAFNLSSNGRMVLNEFIYDATKTSNAALFSLTKGKFTFVAGTVAKTGDMKIDTPSAVLGIRGTTPRVEIMENGSVKFSTLIEESKTAAVQTPDKARDSGRSRARGPAQRPVGGAESTICRGC